MPSPYIAFCRHLGFDELDQVVHRMTNVAGDVLGFTMQVKQNDINNTMMSFLTKKDQKESSFQGLPPESLFILDILGPVLETSLVMLLSKQKYF